MRRWIFLLVLGSLLAGCSGKQDGATSNVAAVGEARVEHKRAAGMAYEHEITLEITEGQTRQVSDAVKQACAALPENGCTLLEASVHSGAMAGATLRMRMVPDGVNKVLRALDGRGKILTQSSKAEDLVEPLEDGERKMAMLTGYRDQLLTLTRQRALDPEALIKLHRELAEVQSEIDNATRSQAQLRRRVDTELVTVAMQEDVREGKVDAVKLAVADFGGDLLQGVARLITLVASLIPFVLAGTVVYLVWRRLRAGKAGRAPHRRDSQDSK